MSPRPFILDLRKIAKLKKLVQFAFGQSYRDEMGFEIINSKNIKSKPRIIVGSKFENPTFLNRNDASGQRHIWTNDEVFWFLENK